MADVSSPQSCLQSCFFAAASVMVLLCTIYSASSTAWDDQPEYSTVIYIDSNGTDNSSCWTGEIECATINMALRGILYNWTKIYINPGAYYLENGNETEIVAKQHITIAGSSDHVNNTIIHCDGGAGIYFMSSVNITIANVTLIGCGIPIPYEFYNFQAAITTRLCHDLFIINVRIHHSNGTGLLILQHRGEMFVDNCTVSNNIVDQRVYVPHRFNYIGGGIFILGGVNSSFTVSNSVIRESNFGRFKPYYTLGKCTLYDLFDFTLAGISAIHIEGSLTIDSTHIFNNNQGLFMTQNFNISTTRIINSTFYSNNQSSKVQISGFVVPGTSILFHYVNMSNEALLFEAKLAEKSESVLETFWDDEYMAIYNNLRILISPATENYLLNTKFITINCNFDIISYRGLCSNLSNHTALCPYSYSMCVGFFCSCANGHTGRLCGGCDEGYSVPVNSPLLSCVNCSDSISIVKGWAVLIAMEFMPLTFMVVLIAVLNVNLNQGSLNAFVFFCQILSISFPSVGYPTWFVTRPTDTQFLVNPQSINIALFPLSVWNMDFVTVLGSTSMYLDKFIYHIKFHGFPVCVSSSTSPLGAIMFWYLIAFYPILLLLLMYVSIIAYDKGYRGCVCILRPLHYLLARFWRKYDIKPSLITTTASIITLCFTQIAAISLKLLHPALYKDHDTQKSVFAFFYDGTQDYFNGLHSLSVVIAIIVLFCLISVIVFLILNPFLWFHRCCINRLPFRKDFLISLTEVFTAPFKHGFEGNSLDYRYFASALFSLRLIIMCFYYVPQYESNVTFVPIMEVTLCCLYIGTIVIFRPYKRVIHVFVEMMLFAILGAMSCCVFYEMPKAILFWRFVFPMYILVLVIAVFYCGFWIVKKIKHASYSCCNKSQSSSSNIEHYDDEGSLLIQSTHSTDHIYSEESIPDRALHPNDYNEILGDNEKPDIDR